MSTYCLLAASVISIHAPREGCDGFGTGDVSGWRYFNPRTPRGVRLEIPTRAIVVSDFNPRTPRGVRRGHVAHLRLDTVISIHAPREGCDMLDEKDLQAIAISIHAPREGCDYRRYSDGRFAPRFQSTHPARGATWKCFFPCSQFINFNPRTPRGVRLSEVGEKHGSTHISIHAPREGCDQGPPQCRP